ncbi:MAG: hypothetical protein ACP5RR_10090, partial [Candidatus Kapaibacteriota bacterium]
NPCVVNVGDVMFDIVKLIEPKVDKSDILSRLNLKQKDYAVMTLHRAENVDDVKRLTTLLNFVDKTDVTKVANWRGEYLNSTSIPKIAPLTFAGSVVLGNAPFLQQGESFEVNRALIWSRYVFPDGTEKMFYGSADVKVENGKFVAYLTISYPGTPDYNLSAKVYYDIEIYRMVESAIGQYVWIYDTYKWQESFNLFDNISVPLALFSTVGSPSNQINTIRLIATGDNYYDALYFSNSNPVPKYVEVTNEESAKKGIRFQERKLDGWSSKESALAFATAFVDLFGNPAKSYSKKVPLKTDINIGDMVDCDGEILPIYKIVYDLTGGYMTIFIGRSVTDTIEFLKETSRTIEAMQKTFY